MKGRFAPSPTGYIHLGNVWVALLSYLSTRYQKGEYIVRIEDIDRQRSRSIYTEALLDDLEWLGFDWDIGPRVSNDESNYYQSKRYDIYEQQLQKWIKENKVYPCFCNRARIQRISSAPHEGEQWQHYDGHCAELTEKERIFYEKIKKPSWRFRVHDSEKKFIDSWQGIQETRLRSSIDDFVLKRSDGMFAYNFAVVMDDALMGITEVVRGYDLLDTTFLQLALFELLNYPAPQYGHVPLLKDSNGVRLSKRQKSITIRELKAAGWKAGEILLYLGKLAGLISQTSSITSCALEDLLEQWENVVYKESLLTKFDILI